MSDNFALELFSGIGGMSLGLHSAGFESHGFDASERAVAMANENGLASTVVDVFDPDIVETMRRVHPTPVLIHSSAAVPWLQPSERKSPIAKKHVEQPNNTSS